ncbi:hypothetical protein WMF45_51270 [Sorangium sp. So ce448]|uniref:hypothetical protein n=1 Tax=Sorangium sp. So ce448 TaxID=3133314 RepID=UPI003F5FB4B5
MGSGVAVGSTEMGIGVVLASKAAIAWAAPPGWEPVAGFPALAAEPGAGCVAARFGLGGRWPGPRAGGRAGVEPGGATVVLDAPPGGIGGGGLDGGASDGGAGGGPLATLPSLRRISGGGLLGTGGGTLGAGVLFGPGGGALGGSGGLEASGGLGSGGGIEVSGALGSGGGFGGGSGLAVAGSGSPPVGALAVAGSGSPPVGALAVAGSGSPPVGALVPTSSVCAPG